MSGKSPKPSRRQVCVGAFRWAALGGIASAGAATLAKRHRLVQAGMCINHGQCQGCVALAGCKLPAALNARHSRQGGNHDRTK